MLKFLLDLIRPTCPRCNGDGGCMDGYYQPEFYECSFCNPDGNNEAEITRIWRGRLWWMQFCDWRYGRRVDRLMAEDERRWADMRYRDNL